MKKILRLAFLTSIALSALGATAQVQTLPAGDTQAQFEANWVTVGDNGEWEWVPATETCVAYAQVSPSGNTNATGTAVGTALVWSQPIEMKAGETFYIQAYGCSADYNDDERFHLLVGTDKENLQPFKTSASSFYYYRQNGRQEPNFQYKPADSSNDRTFVCTEDGQYWIGVRSWYASGSFAGKKLQIAHLKVEKMVDYPQQVKNGKAVAGPNGALCADLSWTWPTKSLSGADLTGELTANVYRAQSSSKDVLFNPNSLIGTVTGGVPGATGIFLDNDDCSSNPITTPGKYYYLVAPINDQGEYSEGKGYFEAKWIGEDEKALNPLNAAAKAEGNDMVVSFRNRLEGYNSGWLNPEKFSNQIQRQKDGGEFTVVAESVKLDMDDNGNASWTDTALEGPGSYIYKVYALYNGVLSAEAKTAAVFGGGTFSAPYEDDFSTDKMGLYTVASTNTSYKWSRVTQGNLQFKSYSQVTSSIFAPAIEFEAGKTYRVSAKAWSDQSGTALKVSVSDAPAFSENAVVSTVSVTGTSSAKQDVDVFFVAAEDAPYYVGFTATVTSNKGIYLDDLKIEETKTIPADVADLDVAADEKGADKGIVSFTVPSTTNAGSDISEISKVEIFRYDSEDNQTSILVKENPAPGEPVSFEDEVPESGMYSYGVVAWLNDNASNEKRSEAIWIGYDYPKAINAYNGFSLSVAEDGTPTLAWQPLSNTVNTVNGGYYDAENVKYRLYRSHDIFTDREEEIIAETSETTFADESIHMAEWGKYKYGVTVVNGDKEGKETKWYTPVTGGFVELPYTPDLTHDGYVDALEGRGFLGDGALVWRNRGETDGTDFTAYLPPFAVNDDQKSVTLKLTVSRGNNDYEENLEVHVCPVALEKKDLSSEGYQLEAAILGSDDRELVTTVPVTASHDEPSTETVVVPTPGTGRYRLALRLASPDSKEVKVHELTIEHNVESGVCAIENEGQATEWYNLQGVRVQNPGEGIYILRSHGKASKVLR